jgi:hypothetical protein
MVDPGHPPAWVVDLYSADPALVEPSAAAHLDTCAECRRAVGLPIVESAPPARDPPLRLRPWWRRPSVLVGAAAALAAALVVGVRMAAVPSDTSPIGAAPHGVKGPTRGGEVTLALRAGESLTVFAPDSGITPSPGDTLVFLAENPHGYPVIAYFEATGDAGVQPAPRSAVAGSATQSLGFKLDAYVGRQRVTLAFFDDAPDTRRLDASLRERWRLLSTEERGRLPVVALDGARETFSWVIETAPR